jgi:hypothetical protein
MPQERATDKERLAVQEIVLVSITEAAVRAYEHPDLRALEQDSRSVGLLRGFLEECIALLARKGATRQELSVWMDEIVEQFCDSSSDNN